MWQIALPPDPIYKLGSLALSASCYYDSTSLLALAIIIPLFTKNL